MYKFIIVFTFPGPRAVNDRLVGYHWVVCLFSPQGQCFYGDPLNSVKIPTNLQETINPYYKARFGSDLDYIFNCSSEAKFPNFPRQLSDAHCCGYVCLLVMILAKEPKFLEFILACNQIKGGPRFIKYPGYYPEFLKQIFQVFSFDKEIKLSLIIAKQDVNKLVKQSSIWTRTPFIREKANINKPLWNHEMAIKTPMSKREEDKNQDCNVANTAMEDRAKEVPFKKVIRKKRIS